MASKESTGRIDAAVRAVLDGAHCGDESVIGARRLRVARSKDAGA
jgi:hypothetical protein